MREIMRRAVIAAVGAMTLGCADVGAAMAADIPVPAPQPVPEYGGQAYYGNPPPVEDYVYPQPAPVYVYPQPEPYYYAPPVAVVPAPYYRRPYRYVTRGPIYRPYLARGYGRFGYPYRGRYRR